LKIRDVAHEFEISDHVSGFHRPLPPELVPGTGTVKVTNDTPSVFRHRDLDSQRPSTT
jgi:hypothetical protein